MNKCWHLMNVGKRFSKVGSPNENTKFYLLYYHILEILVILKSMESKFYIHILAKGNDKERVESTGECSGDIIRKERENEELSIWTCPPKGADSNAPFSRKRGNFIIFTKKQTVRWNTLRVDFVKTNYCKPQLEQCRCKSLLGSLLALDSTINQITGSFRSLPYMAGCKCYLGAAARQGFKFLKIENISRDCDGTREFTVKNYEDKCIELLGFSCYGGAEITRTDPDI